jgi:hypothetical protein
LFPLRNKSFLFFTATFPAELAEAWRAFFPACHGANWSKTTAPDFWKIYPRHPEWLAQRLDSKTG